MPVSCLCEAKSKALICSVASFHGVNAPAMAKVKLPKLGRLEDKTWEEKHGSLKPVMAAPAHL